jgi:hypothetical protein
MSHVSSKDCNKPNVICLEPPQFKTEKYAALQNEASVTQQRWTARGAVP